MAVADYNGDGIPDVAVVHELGDTVILLIGNGDGTFQRDRRFDVGHFPQSLSTGDFNGDGILDLAVANFSSNTASIWVSGRVPALLPPAILIWTAGWIWPSPICSPAVSQF